MKPSRLYLLTIFVLALATVRAQTGFDLKVDKPAPYEERVLRAEKTANKKKLSGPGKFFQNLTSHYNYFFNASNKLNEVVSNAKLGFKDDYTQLLPFYNYHLDQTAENSLQLDSVIYKAQTGIVMHDLRGAWMDNFYLLWGAAWFYEKKFDSAALMFQFVNYAFADKEKDGYYRYIGSRMDGNNALSVSTKEKEGMAAKLSVQPSRNLAFIWQARTQIELGNMAEAGSLIATLKNDPLFPARLRNDLDEVQAYWFFKQNQWDSSAAHLLAALDQASNKQERARWEFLAAQMLERTGKTEDAEKWYTKAIAHTTDPVMEVYGRLNLVRINKSGGENYVDKNIAELLKMARRDKYSDYRDIIYFMAAQMEIDRHNLAAAQELLVKSARYNTSDPVARNRSFLLVADLAYERRSYLEAASFYDSVNAIDLDPQVSLRISDRKRMLGKVVAYQRTLTREDSLQRIAAMPEQERTVYITRLLRTIRRQQGLTDEGLPTSGSVPSANPVIDLFTGTQAKGEWYFYNTNLKARGVSQFKQIWGTRPNVDNWRRFSDVNQQLLTQVPTNNRDANKAAAANLTPDNTPSFNNLLNNLPLTATQLQSSNDSVQYVLTELGNTYMNEMEDYPSAVEALEALRKRFPSHPRMNETIYHLYFAYKKAGNEAKAEEMRQLLTTQYAGSRFAAIVATGKDPAAPTVKSPETTRAYESVYDLFISGKFDEAEAAKKIADSTYRTTYWQPQLLYIEAVYLIRRREDSLAKDVLQTLISQNANTPLALKAANLLDVLGRRAQIEAELTNLQIQRPVEDTVASRPVITPPAVVKQAPPVVDPASTISKDTSTAIRNTQITTKPVITATTDTITRKPVVQAPATAYVYTPVAKQFFMIILDNVDPMFVGEVKNSFDRYNREKFYNRTFQINIRDLDSSHKLVLIGDFAGVPEAIDYFDKAKRTAPNEVIPWLKREKYTFSMVSEQNLEILLIKKDLTQYRKFLDQNLPGKF